MAQLAHTDRSRDQLTNYVRSGGGAGTSHARAVLCFGETCRSFFLESGGRLGRELMSLGRLCSDIHVVLRVGLCYSISIFSVIRPETQGGALRACFS